MGVCGGGHGAGVLRASGDVRGVEAVLGAGREGGAGEGNGGAEGEESG